MVGNKKVLATGHQPRKNTIGDWRPSPSQQSAAVKPTQSDAVEPTQDEMTLRDQFAMAALSGKIACEKNFASYKDLYTFAYTAADFAYTVADEMIKYRKKMNNA